MILHRYRVLRPLMIHGRIAATGEVIRIPPADAEEHVESGHLTAIAEINGEVARQWTVPEVR